MDRTLPALSIVVIGGRRGSAAEIVEELLKRFYGRTATAAIESCPLLFGNPQPILIVPPVRREACRHGEWGNHRNRCRLTEVIFQYRRTPNDQNEQQKENAKKE